MRKSNARKKALRSVLNREKRKKIRLKKLEKKTRKMYGKN